MKISIGGIEDTTKFLRSSHTDTALISIRDCDKVSQQDYFGIDNLRTNVGGVWVSYFDDIWAPVHMDYGFCPLTYKQLEAMLEWSNTFDNFRIHCRAGVSRSPAVAFVVACKKLPPKEAIGFLNVDIHCPNPWVIQLGCALLPEKAAAMQKEIGLFMAERDARGLYRQSDEEDPCDGMPERIKQRRA